MADTQPRTSHISLLKKLEILPVPGQYTFSLINFTVNNKEHFQTNSPIHNIKTRNEHHFYRPHDNQTCCQKSTFYAGIKIFNSVPHCLTILKKDKAKLK